MASKELVKIKIYDGEEPNSKVYVLSMLVKDLDTYEKAKATKRFINKETQVLEQVIENDLRQVLRDNGIIPQDGSNQALERAITLLECQGKKINIVDRYYQIGDERIIGESPDNSMTIIIEDDILSCAVEVIIEERKNG